MPAEGYEAGESALVLTEEFVVARSALVNLLRSQNVVVRRRALTDEQVSELARAYETAGLSPPSMPRLIFLTAPSSEPLVLQVLR